MNRSVSHSQFLSMVLIVIRSPVVLFLSDGECSLRDEVVRDLCRRAVALGFVFSS